MTAVHVSKIQLPLVVLAALAIAFTSAPMASEVEVSAAQQANVTPAPDVPSGMMELGSVQIPRGVMANGESLAAGTYEVRLTAQRAQPDAPGSTPSYERWVEFVQAGDVKGKEVLSIVPSSEIGDVAESAGPGSGSSKVELLKGNDYLRIWINRDSVNYLIHLPVA